MKYWLSEIQPLHDYDYRAEIDHGEQETKNMFLFYKMERFEYNIR